MLLYDAKAKTTKAKQKTKHKQTKEKRFTAAEGKKEANSMTIW